MFSVSFQFFVVYPKDIQLTVSQNKENQKHSTVKMLKCCHIKHFCLKWLKTSADYFSID